MWIKLFRAEWHKIIGNRWVTGCMVWIFPALAVLISVIALLIVMFSADFRAGINLSPPTWTDTAIVPWFIPNNPLGRGLLIGFTAVYFAGEYQWNTWKSVVPRSSRVPLILVKFFTVALVIIVAFTLMSILLTIGMGILTVAAGATYGPPVDRAVLTDFVEDYGLQVFYAFVTTVIAAGFASFAAMITRSILGSVIVGIVLTIGETMLFLPLYLLAALLNKGIFIHIYRFVPGYNLLNLFTWLNGETPEGLELLSGEVIVDSQMFAQVVLTCWVVGLVALTAFAFQRQDITN